MRQSEKRRLRNLRRRQAIKQAIKEIKQHLAAGEPEKARELLPQLMKAADKAAKGGAIHPNKAARIKSRWMRKVSRA